jgi:uncharacterized protein DUF1585
MTRPSRVRKDSASFCDSEKVPACLVHDVYAYGVGRKTEEQEEQYLSGQTKTFAGNGYRLPDLMAQIASSPAFFKVVVPSGIQRVSARAATAPVKKSGVPIR